MSSTFAALRESQADALSALRGALSAAAVTVPHALGLGLIAFAPLGQQLSVGALALWSAALPAAVLSLLARRPGVVHAPTTVVALLFATVVVIVASAQQALGLGPHGVLAVAGATAALGFTFQWVFGMLRLASLARFLPISVTQGFAAGVGLTMILSQFASGFGSGGWHWDARVLRHALAAFTVVVLVRLVQRRWPQLPGLLPAVLLVSLVLLASGLAPLFEPAVRSSAFAWPVLPDWTAVPWGRVVRSHGLQLVSLALLMAIVNGLDVVVFDQELALEHGLHNDANAVLRRESLAGILCGLCGLIPASTSASRTRIALAQAGTAPLVGPLHAGMLLVVAATGHWWLPYVPMACLAGALLVAGLMQVPANLWSRIYARAAPATWSQSWLVALVFAASGGVGALAAGLLVATFVLLHASANTTLRRALLDGELRSRRLRHAASDSWLASRMRHVAVFQLQGLMSFGVAAHLCEQIVGTLRPDHRRVIVDASRVATWDATALARLVALARDLRREQRQLAACGLDGRSAAAVAAAVTVFTDLDHALEWAEDAMLEEMPRGERSLLPAAGRLGELADGLGAEGRQALEALLRHQEVEPQSQVFQAGDADSDLVVVQRGRITLCTAWPPASGLRLASVGQGMAFGEMAFLNDQPRTAWAGAEAIGAGLVRLARRDFDDWARAHPADALVFIANLAQIGTRRLAATTRQLRSVLE